MELQTLVCYNQIGNVKRWRRLSEEGGDADGFLSWSSQPTEERSLGLSVFEALSLINQVVDNFMTLVVLVTVLTAENKHQK